MKTIRVTLNSIQENPYTAGKDYTFSVDSDAIKEIIKQNPELLTPTPTHKRKYFVPKLEEEYRYIDDNRGVYEDTHRDWEEDKYRISTGNCFATEQDAQDELSRRQALVRIWNNYDDKYSWDIDWDNDEQYKYEIGYDYRLKKILGEIMSRLKCNTELPYFKSAEERNQFVKDNEIDLLTIFNIKK